MGANSTGSNNFVMPVLPPPLPNTFPDDDSEGLPGYRKSLPPPYADQNNINNRPNVSKYINSLLYLFPAFFSTKITLIDAIFFSNLELFTTRLC